MKQTDILVIGSGVAGLTYTIKVAEEHPDKKIMLVTKNALMESNTRYAQGGIAAVWNDEDSFESHVEDTLRAGDYVNNEAIVRMVIEEGPGRLRELIEWGANFDKNEHDAYDLGREGGHEAHRILHHKDITGYEIARALVAKVTQLPNVELLEFTFAIDLITDHHLGKKVTRHTEKTCYGAYVLDQKSEVISIINAKVTLLASGGAGQVYGHTTNPVIATGDGIAMAYRAKAHIADMEYVQFHPTSFYEFGVSPSFLVSEAVRGFGAYLRNKSGERFVLKVDERGELASRDIVSKAIDQELKVSGEYCVYLDCTHLDQEEFYKHFPTITDHCKSKGIDPAKDWIPVVPACHYMCGGVIIDKDGQTSIDNLLAIGECSRSGLHGANRLASNSLLEGLVFAQHAADKTSELLKSAKFNPEIPDWNAKGTTHPNELILITHSRRELQTIMSDYVAIVRSNVRLERALRRLKIHHEETEALYKSTKISPQLCELRNLTTIAYLIVTQSKAATENRGAFYNIDLD